jgi:broad specificity phosphatase PhoE
MRKPMSDSDRRTKRRRRRLQAISIYVLLAIGLAWFFELQATTTIIFVRHAEKELVGEDPGLSAAGRQRAEELARQLADADVVAGVDAVYSTPFRRTLETAHAVADRLDLPVHEYAPDDNDAVLDAILKTYKGKIILVVGHSNTVPTLIADVGASKKVPAIDEDEYDNLYVVSIPWYGKTKTIRLRYGEPYRPVAP